MKSEKILEEVDMKKDLEAKPEVEVKETVRKKASPKPTKKKREVKKTRKTKYVYKITNKTFQPIQLVIDESEMVLLGSRKRDNVAFVKEATWQIKNLEKKGMIKIRKMY